MNIRASAAAALSPAQWAAWSDLQQADPALDSPYFRPEFTQAVAAVRDDVEVALLEEQGIPVGFLPFQRARGDIGGPVGGAMCDFQGPITRRELAIDAEELLRACGLAAWRFDHLLASLPAWTAYHRATAPSPYLDLAQGFDAYWAERRKTGTRKINKTLGLGRKLAAEVGPLRLVPHTDQPEIFQTLLTWKTDQYRQTGVPNVLAAPWKQQLLAHLAAQQSPRFAGMLSALYAGEELVAVHLGLRCGHVLHAWFPAYNPALATYSPGSLLWVELARAAESQGIRRIDLGKGQEAYKLQFMSGATLLAEGAVDRRRWGRAWESGCHRVRQWVRASPLRAPARALSRRIAPWLYRLRES